MSAMFLPISLLAVKTRTRVIMMATEPIVVASRTSSLVKNSKMAIEIVFHRAEKMMMVTLISVIKVEKTRMISVQM